MQEIIEIICGTKCFITYGCIIGMHGLTIPILSVVKIKGFAIQVVAPVRVHDIKRLKGGIAAVLEE